MIRKKRLIFILIYSVLFLFSCGIPRMIPWEVNEQYNISISELEIRLSFDVSVGTPNQDSITLTPYPDTPVVRFFYVIVPNPSESNSSVNNLISSFGSRYSSGFPTTYENGNPAYTTTVTYDDESIRVGLFELTVYDENSRRFVPTSSYFTGMDNFIEDGNGWHSMSYSFSSYKIPDGNGYYIKLIVNGDESNPYYLARSNSEPFTNSIDDYIQGNSNREFLSNASGHITDFQIRVYAAASFIFEHYTTRATITSGTGYGSGYTTIL